MKLADFSKEEAELLASMPYKAGIFVSHSDDVEGEGDDEKEMKALERCIVEITKLHKDDVFIQEITKKTLESKASWDDWMEDAWHCPDHASKAAAMVRAKGGEAGHRKYCAVLMEIASTVARAYGEHGAFDEDDGGDGFFAKITASLKGLSNTDAGHPMNVSASEDGALSKLAAALKI